MTPDERKEQNKAAFRAVMGTAEGRRVIGLILGVCNLLGPSTASDPYKTAYNEGMRGVGIWLKNTINALDKHNYITILKEQADNG